MGRRIGLAVVLAAAVVVVAYKAAGRRDEPRLRAAARGPAVVLVADAREADNDCGCGEIIRRVRAAKARGVSVAELAPDDGVLSLVLAPCGTPVLAAVLSFAAHERGPVYGAVLLFAYGLGVGLPMLLVGTAARGLAQRLDRLGKSAWTDRLAGGAMLALGFYLLWVA